MPHDRSGAAGGPPGQSDLRGRLLEAAESVRDSLSEIAIQYGVREADILRSIVRDRQDAEGATECAPDRRAAAGRMVDRQRRQIEEENHILRNAIEFLWDVNRKAGRTPKSSTRWSAN